MRSFVCEHGGADLRRSSIEEDRRRAVRRKPRPAQSRARDPLRVRKWLAIAVENARNDETLAPDHACRGDDEVPAGPDRVEVTGTIHHRTTDPVQTRGDLRRPYFSIGRPEKECFGSGAYQLCRSSKRAIPRVRERDHVAERRELAPRDGNAHEQDEEEAHV